MDHLQHFCDDKHPLVFNENETSGWACDGCGEAVYGPSYYCKEGGCPWYVHHKSCAELPLGLHHPLHPKHPLILFSPERYEDKEFPYENVKCEVCKGVDHNRQYSYGCARCNFNIHIGCTVSPIQAKSHDHPLIPIGKSITFTCEICGEEGKGVPNSCVPCSFLIHRRCASFPRRVKVVRHKHPLHLTHSSEVDQSDFRICPLCVQKVDTHCGLYYCSKCDFVTHLDCAIEWANMDELIDEESTQSKATLEIEAEFHDHPLIPIGKSITFTCDICGKEDKGEPVSCSTCSFWIHRRCVRYPRRVKVVRHKHPLHLTHSSHEEDQFDSRICLLCVEGVDTHYGLYYCFTCDFVTHLDCAMQLQNREELKDEESTESKATLEIEAEFHDHPLIPIGKSITFTCDICGKEGKGVPISCSPCCFLIHRRCVRYPRRVKVVHHKHPLHLTHSSHEVDQSDSRICPLCVQKVDTHYGLYYCSKCDFVTHLDCALYWENMEELIDEESTEFADSLAYKVKKTNVEMDGTKIAIEIKHFSHEHDLKLSDDEVQNNEICDGCVKAILSPFYRCVKCSFFLHKSCAELPRKKQHPLHRHPLTLLTKSPFSSKPFECYACKRPHNGFNYSCKECNYFNLDVQCSLMSDILTHPGHDHQLILSSVQSEHNCSSCGFKISPIFRCTTCDFALDFKCATLPHTTRYKQHEHPFTLCYTAEDDSSEYYCDICEEVRDPKHWFYYCEDCSYPAHPKCILGNEPNVK